MVETLDSVLSAAGPDGVTGVMLMRLQRIRELLQVYGYGGGDAIGDEAHTRLRGLLRPCDRLYRLGEFEFVALLPGLHDGNHALLAGNRVRRGFQAPLRVGDTEVMTSVITAIAVAPEHGCTATALLRSAEYAFGRAMRSPDAMAVHMAGGEPALVPYGRLREAITGNRLEAWLQPILDLRTRRVSAAESLSRWHDPELGQVPPDRFIPMAERTGLISELTWWSINASLRQLASARRRKPALGISINLSPRVFGEPGLVEHLDSTLQVWGVEPEGVTLEVTETALMEDPALSERLLRRLCDAGFGVAFDDFGTGYSSLAYLKRFPATELKIDRSFIQDLPRDPRSLPLVQAIIDLAHRLELTVVAEGVEDAETLELLAATGCDHAQGFFIQRPQPAEEFVRGLGATAGRLAAGGG
nr:GGDEF domain-containing phosphodiesterase [Lysobacter sp. GX 14042]